MTAFTMNTYNPFWDLLSLSAPPARKRHCGRGRRYHKRGHHEAVKEIHREPEEKAAAIAPPLDIYDTEENYMIVASVPGVLESNISIDFDTDTKKLTISGSSAGTLIYDDDYEYRRKYLKVGERRVGSFRREITLPKDTNVDEGSIKAHLSNGLLKIVLPKLPRPDKKRIVIEIDDESDENAKEVESAKTEELAKDAEEQTEDEA